jgi:tRNA G18 (ribose-2'-O)-methylase SpoU
VIIRIDDPDDPRIEPYRAVRDRDIAGRGERFVVEGEVVLGTFLTHRRFAVESLLLAEQRVQRLAGLFDRFDLDVPIYVASRQVMDAVVGFPIHRGVLAIGRRSREPTPSEVLANLPEQALVIGLVGLTNHDNVGGIFRNAAAFGADAVLMDPATCDPLYRKAIRVSVGATLCIPYGRAPDAASLCHALEEAGFEIIALSPAGAAELQDVAPAPRTALLLGAEGPGLPSEILARCRTVRIRMAPGFDSLNVATTSGIALYHLRASGAAGDAA